MNRDDLNVKCREALATRLRHDDEYGAEHGWSVGDDSLWLSSVSFTTIFDTLFPLIEADVREQVAQEIEALGVYSDGGKVDDIFQFGYAAGRSDAARIARGATQNGDSNE